MTSRLSARGLSVGYSRSKPSKTSLTFEVEGGESLAVQGKSGSGKTSLLLTLNGLLRPVEGQVVVDGIDIWSLKERQRSALRRERIGYVFQFGEMLPELSVGENVALPLLIAGASQGDAGRRVSELLEPLGVSHLIGEDVRAVSGGELQRVAVARALVHRPTLVLADEPTGALDPQNATMVVNLLQQACRKENAALVMVTHDPNVAAMADRSTRLDGSQGVAS